MKLCFKRVLDFQNTVREEILLGPAWIPLQGSNSAAVVPTFGSASNSSLCLHACLYVTLTWLDYISTTDVTDWVP